MLMKTLMTILALIALALPAWADTVYLTCTVVHPASDKHPKETQQGEIAMDTVTRKITHTINGTYAFNTEGFFTADTITYQEIHILSGIKSTRRYILQRQTLALQEVNMLESIKFPDKIAPKVMTSHGFCQIRPMPKNKI